MRLRWPLKRFTNGRPVDLINFELKAALLAAGYAVVTIDVRGTGAFGALPLKLNAYPDMLLRLLCELPSPEWMRVCGTRSWHTFSQQGSCRHCKRYTLSVRPSFYDFLSPAASLGLSASMTRCPGASYGQWRMPWAPEEREDSVTIIEWITRQTWSNGQVHLPFLCLMVAFICQQRGSPPGDFRDVPPSTDTVNKTAGCAVRSVLRGFRSAVHSQQAPSGCQGLPGTVPFLASPCVIGPVSYAGLQLCHDVCHCLVALELSLLSVCPCHVI